MCICVFTNKATFRTIQIHIRRCAKEKTFAETENRDLFICVYLCIHQQNHKSQPYSYVGIVQVIATVSLTRSGVIDFLLSSIAAAAQRSHVLNYLMALAQLW